MISKNELENTLLIIGQLSDRLRYFNAERFLINNLDYSKELINEYLSNPQQDTELKLGALARLLYPPQGGMIDFFLNHEDYSGQSIIGDTTEELIRKLWNTLNKWDLMRRGITFDS